MSALVGVVFMQPHRIYNAGEAAGFTPDAAAALIASGVARAASPVPPAEPKRRRGSVPPAAIITDQEG